MNKYLDKYLKYKRKYKELQMIGGGPDTYGELEDYRLSTLLKDKNVFIDKDDHIINFLNKICQVSEPLMEEINRIGRLDRINITKIFDIIYLYAKRFTVYSSEDNFYNLFLNIFGINYELFYYFFIPCDPNENGKLYIYFINANYTWSFFTIVYYNDFGKPLE